MTFNADGVSSLLMQRVQSIPLYHDTKHTLNFNFTPVNIKGKRYLNYFVKDLLMNL